MMTTTTTGPAGNAGDLGVRQVRNARFCYRIGTTDELVLMSQYGAARFFPAGYQPREDATILDVGAHIGVFAVLAAAPRSRCCAPSASCTWSCTPNRTGWPAGWWAASRPPASPPTSSRATTPPSRAGSPRAAVSTAQ